ncbi:MAG: SpoIVB peptidase S55 domain-containing protein [Armatimonadota bacterium]
MKRLGWLVAYMVLLLGICMNGAWAQLQWDPQEFMGIEEIKPGMVGYGKTVYEGTKIETFDVEVIGVLRKVDFGFDMVLIKITSGPVVDRKLQTVEGMSGSPIYIDDRLIGAYAYGWNFQQEAIGGVTPIAAMLECSQPGAASAPLVGSLVPSNKVLRIGDRLITNINVAATQEDGKALQAKSSPTTMVLTPVSTPIFVSGMSDKVLGPLQQLLGRYNLRAMAGPGDVEGPAPPLEAGSAVAVSLMEGDANLSAIGTVTYVKGNTVLAFGHPFMGIGKIDLPMAPAHVHGVLSSSMSSFKLASPFSKVGRVHSDRNFAVAGTIGEQASTIPVSLYLNDKSRNFTRRYSVEMMDHPDFSSLLLYQYVIYAGTMQMGDLMSDDGTFTGRMLVKTDKLGDIDQQVVVSPRTSLFEMPFGNFYVLTDLLQTNPYEDVKINSIFVDVDYQPGRNYALVEKVIADRPVARPGETVNLTVKVRPYGKPLEIYNMPVRVPENATEPVMLVAVIGGVMWPVLKMYDRPYPMPEQGLKGIVDWLTVGPSTKSLVTAKILPTPSYGYRGRMLRDLPMQILDLLRFADTGVVPQGQGGGGEERAGLPMTQGAMPTAYITSQEIPYVTLGAQIVGIAVETEDRVVQPSSVKSGFSLQLPVLSSSLAGNRPMPGEEPPERYEPSSSWTMWMDPLHRARFAELEKTMRMVDPQPLKQPVMPILVERQVTNTLPLSLSQISTRRQAGPTGEMAPGEEGDGGEGDENDMGMGEEESMPEDEEEIDTSDDESGSEGYASMKDLLTKRQTSWGLIGRDDFLRGKHLGTGVTSKGNLVLVPSVRSLYHTTDMVPWKMVTVGDNTYVAGWNSKQIIRIGLDGKSDVFFTREGGKVEAITSLAADANGNLLIGTWPDQHVVLISPAGKVINDWQLPGNTIWDLAVTADGRRYAATDGGTVYLIRDDKQVPLAVACSVPDKHVVAMIADGESILLATSPRGKVYRLGKDNLLRSVYEGKSMITSLAVDKAGNLYVGASPSCQVIRITPGGLQQEVMRGMGRGNRHVLAMRMVGNELYVATGPAGGIYCVSNPAGQDFEVTSIFAREDLRGGAETDGVGPESVMVNALTVNRNGELLAAASTPGQVLKLEPRKQGAFLSTVLQTPVVAKWGRLDLQTEVGNGQKIVIESRSGNTAVPDGTWSPWSAIAQDWSTLTSPPATYAQFRVTMAGTETTPSLTYARLFYQSTNRAPIIRLQAPKSGLYWSGTKEIRWEANDPDEDELTYTVFTSADRGKTWQQIVRVEPEAEKNGKGADGEDTDSEDVEGVKEPPKTAAEAQKAADEAKVKPPTRPAPKAKDEPVAKDGAKPAATPPAAAEAKEPEKPAKPKQEPNGELKATSVPWDTKSATDGTYLIRVIATDKYAKPTDSKSAQVISGLITVDNSVPAVKLEDKVYGWETVEEFVVTDSQSPIVGGKYRIDEGPWTALVADDGIFNRRQEQVKMVTPNGDVKLAKGEYKLQIQVLDAAGNLLDKTITVMSGEQAPRPQARIDFLPIEPVAGVNDLQLLDIMLRGLQMDQ